MNKRKYGLKFKFGVIFVIFILVSVIATGIATYLNQTQIYEEQLGQTLQDLSAYLAVSINADGNDFVEYQKYFLEHCQEMDVPADFDEEDALKARGDYERLFADMYPGKIPGEDIDFDDLAPEVQNAYAVYNHEYYLLMFEKANEMFGLTYTYYFAPTGEDNDVIFILDPTRETKDDVNINLGDVVDEDPGEHDKI